MLDCVHGEQDVYLVRHTTSPETGKTWPQVGDVVDVYPVKIGEPKNVADKFERAREVLNDEIARLDDEIEVRKGQIGALEAAVQALEPRPTLKDYFTLSDFDRGLLSSITTPSVPGETF